MIMDHLTKINPKRGKKKYIKYKHMPKSMELKGDSRRELLRKSILETNKSRKFDYRDIESSNASEAGFVGEV